MSAQSAVAARYRRYPRPAFASTFERGPAIARPQASPDLIDAVLRHADRRESVGGCRVRLSVSDLDKVDEDTRRLLGETYRRLTEIAIIWDQREDQIVRIAHLPQPRSIVEDDEEVLWRHRPSRRAA